MNKVEKSYKCKCTNKKVCRLHLPHKKIRKEYEDKSGDIIDLLLSRSHIGLRENNNQYTCPLCKIKYSSIQGIRRHIKEFHNIV